MAKKIIARKQIEGKGDGASQLTVDIDGIRYNAVTPKFILNKDLFGTQSDIRYKTKDYITDGINVVDIDWDGAVIGDTEIHTTSQLLTLFANMYINYKKQTSGDSSYLWEDVITIDPNYKLYYEDESNTVLSNFTPLSVYSLTNTNIAPFTAHHIGVYDENNNRLYELSLDSQYATLSHSFGVRLYRVGLMSDVHHDDTCQANESEHIDTDNGNRWNPYEDVDHVLTYYADKEDIEFVCCAGDISTDSIEQVKAFSEHVKKLGKGKSIYTCKGNHDNAASAHYDGEDGNNPLWLQYTIPTNSLYTLNFFKSGDKTSFYFLRNNDVYIFFNVDYNTTGSTGYKGLTREDYDYDNIDGTDWGNSTRCYHPDTIKELQQLLDTYRNNRCFIFTHQPFVNKAGNVGYSYTNNRSASYVLNGIQFAILNEMNNYYKNSIWFSGHTHYQWKWHKISNRANVCNWDCLNDNYNFNDFSDYGQNRNNKYSEDYMEGYKKSAYNVHIPSTSRPLRPESEFPSIGYSELIADPGCEGAIMDIYANGVNLRGIQFADENTEFTANTEIHGDKRLIVASDINIDISKQGFTSNGQKITQCSDGYIELTFGSINPDTGRYDQRYYILNYLGNYVEIEDIQIISNGQSYTDELLSKDNPYIGFYGEDGKYHLTNTTAKITALGRDSANNQLEGIELPLSSKFLTYSPDDLTLPLTVRFKAYTVASSDLTSEVIIDYEDNYVSDANYWIPVPQVATNQIESKSYEYFEEYVQKFNR